MRIWLRCWVGGGSYRAAGESLLGRMSVRGSLRGLRAALACGPQCLAGSGPGAARRPARPSPRSLSGAACRTESFHSRFVEDLGLETGYSPKGQAPLSVGQKPPQLCCRSRHFRTNGARMWGPADSGGRLLT